METPVNASRTEAHVDQALIAALNELLEAERAGARVARAYSVSAPVASVGEALLRVGRDEAWCCGMLTRHIERLGGRVSRKTGAFYDKALRQVGIGDRLDYLARGQDWVVRRLQELLPGIEDSTLRHDLGRMLAMHERNISRCAALARRPGG